MEAQVFGWKQCSTCRKAVAFLEERGVQVTLRDIFAQPLAPEEIRALGAGDVASLLSRNSPAFRASGHDPAALDEDGLVAVLQENPRFVKRPVILLGEARVVGFDRKALEAILARS